MAQAWFLKLICPSVSPTLPEIPPSPHTFVLTCLRPSKAVPGLPGRTNMLICDHFKFSMELSSDTLAYHMAEPQGHGPYKFSQANRESPLWGLLCMDVNVEPRCKSSTAGRNLKPEDPDVSQSMVPSAYPLSKTQLPLLTGVLSAELTESKASGLP